MKKLFLLLGMTSLFGVQPMNFTADAATYAGPAITNVATYTAGTVDLAGAIAVKTSSGSSDAWIEEENYEVGAQYTYKWTSEMTFQPGLYYFMAPMGGGLSLNYDDVVGSIIHASALTSGYPEYYKYDQITGIQNDIELVEGFYYVKNEFRLVYEFNDERDWQVFAQLSWDYYEIRDGQAPVIDGENYFIVNVNNMISKDTILSQIYATDNIDGSVPIVIDSTTYDSSVPVVGEHEMFVSATDAAGNTAEATIIIKVVDVDAPVIDGEALYEVGYDAVLPLSDVEANLTVSDNYDKNCSLDLVNENYTTNISTVGSYQAIYKATDSSGNVSREFVVTINVVDEKAPVIVLPANIELGTTSNLTLDAFKQNVSVTDGYDGVLNNYSITGFEAYSNSSKKPGTYNVVVTATDAAGNTSSAATNIIVRDTSNPEIWLGDHFIAVQKGEVLTDEMIKEYAARALNIDASEIIAVACTYDANVPGNYSVLLSLNTGEEVEMTLVVAGEKVDDGSDNVFNNIFSADYWKQMGNEWATAANWANIANYNFLQWATVVVAAIFLLGIIASVIRKKR